MQYVYATHLPIGAESTRSLDVIDRVSTTLEVWLRDRLALEVEDWAAGTSENERADASWETIIGEAGGLLRLTARHLDRGGAPWKWQVDTWLGVEPAGAWIRTRIGLEPRHEGAVVDPNVSVGAPRFLHVLGDELKLSVDGRPLDSWWKVDRAAVDGYVSLLEDGRRRLPVVTVTRPPSGPAAVAPERLAERLAGVAHVVGVEPDATYAVSDRITPSRSCFGGAVRLYWPGFTRSSPMYGHPLWLPRGAYLGSTAFMDEIAARLGRASALAYGAPRLEATLRREAQALRVAQAAARREEQARQLEASRTTGGLSAEELEVFSAELEEESRRRSELEEQVLELQVQLEDEREGRERAQQQASEAWTLLSRSGSPSTAEDTHGLLEPQSVLEAVEQAASSCEHLVFTQAAYESAEESQFAHPDQVLDDLELLNCVAGEWVTGAMNGDFRQAFEGRHPNFRSGISQTASTQYRSDYEINYGNQTVLLGPHLCRGGVGAPPTILRIYWYKDDEGQKLVVGHVGRKLRDVSNRN